MIPPTPTTEPVTAPDLLVAVREQRVVRDAAGVRLLVLATEWADRHTVEPAAPWRSTKSFLEDLPGDHGADPEEHEWLGLPELAWDTAASFAAALGMSTGAGKAFLRDALVLAHRLPRVWARVLAGDVASWRARRIAQTVLGAPDDVVAHVDAVIAPRAGQVGGVLLERALDEAMLRLHPEERELDHLAALDARYARLYEQSINHVGIAEFIVRGDWADVAAFDDTVAAVAAALGEAGCTESLDVRRSMAVGVLADPARALALLHPPAPAPAPAPGTEAGSEPAFASAADPASKPKPGSVFIRRPRRTVVLNLDLTPGHLAGLDPVILDVEGRAVLEQVVRLWCSRPDLAVHVRPIRHCGGCTDCTTTPDHDTQDHDSADQDEDEDVGVTYTPSADLRERVARRDRHCVFPFCTRPAARCDTDHITPFDHDHPTRGGPTSPDNLAPLCRHHHRLKTHAGWTYTMIEPGTYLWADRYRQQFLTTRDGTTDLTQKIPRE